MNDGAGKGTLAAATAAADCGQLVTGSNAKKANAALVPSAKKF